MRTCACGSSWLVLSEAILHVLRASELVHRLVAIAHRGINDIDARKRVHADIREDLHEDLVSLDKLR